MEEKKIEKIIDKFQAGSKAVRQRLILLGLFWIIVLGISLIKKSEVEKWNSVMESEAVLNWMMEASDSTLKKLDSIKLDDPMLPGLVNLENYVDNWDTLSESFARSNFRNKAPIKQALYELQKKQSTLFKNPTISFFGVQLTIDPWYYMGLLIILLLLHDLTRIILYQKKIKELLLNEKVEKWELGYEQLDYFGESYLSTDKFIRFVSSLLLGLILLSPVAASILSMRLNSFGVEEDVFLEAINNFFLFLIIIHTVIVFYIENVFGMRKCIDFLSGKDRKLNIDFYLMWGIWFIISSFYTILWVRSSLELTSGLKIIFALFILMCLISLPVGIWLNHIKQSSKWGKGLIFFSLLINSCWIFIYCPSGIHYSIEIFEDNTLKFMWYLIAVFITTLIYLKFFLSDKSLDEDKSKQKKA